MLATVEIRSFLRYFVYVEDSYELTFPDTVGMDFLQDVAEVPRARRQQGSRPHRAAQRGAAGAAEMMPDPALHQSKQGMPFFVMAAAIRQR